MIIHEDNRLKDIDSELCLILVEMENHYIKSTKLASIIIEKMAREVLKEHTDLDEFIMAMGSYFFTYKESDENLMPISQKMNKSFNYYYEDSEPFLKPLNDLISKWDNVLKITGHSMRFTENGEKITNW